MRSYFAPFLLVLACLTALQLAAKPTPPKTPAAVATPAASSGTTAVAKVIEIKDVNKGAGKLEYARPDTFYAAYPDMDAFVHDKIKTDANTVAALEFVIGGRVGINRNSIIEIVSQGGVQEQGKPTVKRIVIRQGGMWAKVAKRTEPLEIQTNAGVMGIKGTEFVIDSPPDGGNTTLSVLEGSVEVKDNDGKLVGLCNPGEQYILALKGVPIKNTSDPEKLRDNLQNSPTWRDMNKALGIVALIANFIPGGGRVGGLLFGINNVMIQKDSAHKAVAAFVAARSLVPIRGQAGQVADVIGAGLNFWAATSKPEKEEFDYPSELWPDGAHGTGLVASAPTFRWQGVADADGYVVMVSSSEDFQSLEWTSRVQAGKGPASLAYPSSAKPLSAGKHFWRVVPVTADNKPVDKKQGSQSFFEVGAQGLALGSSDPTGKVDPRVVGQWTTTTYDKGKAIDWTCTIAPDGTRTNLIKGLGKPFNVYSDSYIQDHMAKCKIVSGTFASDTQLYETYDFWDSNTLLWCNSLHWGFAWKRSGTGPSPAITPLPGLDPRVVATFETYLTLKPADGPLHFLWETRADGKWAHYCLCPLGKVLVRSGQFDSFAKGHYSWHGLCSDVLGLKAEGTYDFKTNDQLTTTPDPFHLTWKRVQP